MKRAGVVLLIALVLPGCGGESHQELRQWMRDQGANAKPRIEPLPQVKPYEAFTYNAGDLPDPFKPRRIGPTAGGGKLQPDLNRRKEPLEAYSLDTVQMVGTLTKANTLFALVRTNERNIYEVHVGNYIGQNFGIITSITENEIHLKELVQDSAGDWSERTTTLALDDSDQRQEQKR